MRGGNRHPELRGADEDCGGSQLRRKTVYGTELCHFVSHGSDNAAHIEYSLACKVRAEYGAQHMASRLVVTCAKRHLGVDKDVVTCLRYVGVEGAVYNTLVVDDNRLEVVLLPLGIPVLTLYFYGFVCNLVALYACMAGICAMVL